MFVPLCEAWPLPATGCVAITGTAPVTGTAVAAASEYLWALSGQQYGLCSVQVRPCRQGCAPSWAPATWPGWWSGGWPWLATPGSTLWLDAVCGRCAGDCGCTTADTLVLPQPVQAVTEVLIDGSPLPASGYILYNGDLLVRTGGEQWPLCQEWGVPVTGTGAWAVTMQVGNEVPALGSLALAATAAEMAVWCTDTECKHPAYTTAVTRQGVTQEFPSLEDLQKTGMPILGGQATMAFIQAVNPKGLRWGAGIWNPDDVLAAPRRHTG